MASSRTPDLAKLDAGVELGGQIAHELPEVDPLLGGEGEHRPVATGQLGAKHLDGQPVRGGALPGEGQRFGYPMLDGGGAGQVPVVGAAEHSGERCRRRPRNRWYGDRAELRLAAIARVTSRSGR